ncbi:MAG: hypothetical protein Q8Q89_02205 [bacterium]|nr:hypothetical protein [bacterium]
MNPAVRLALMALIFIGVGAPLLKVSQRVGINASELLIINSFSSLMLGLIGYWFLDYKSTGFHVVGISLAVVATMILNTGFLLTNHSLSLEGGLVSVIYAITPVATMLTIFIGLIFLSEAQRVVVYQLILGALLIMVGTILVATSIKTN